MPFTSKWRITLEAGTPYSFMRYLVSSIALLIVACSKYQSLLLAFLFPLFLYAHFNGHAVGISGHAVQATALAGLSAAAYGPTVTGFRVRVILPDFALETNVKISTGLCRAALIVIVNIVLLRYLLHLHEWITMYFNSSATRACVVCSEVRVLVNFQVAHSSFVAWSYFVKLYLLIILRTLLTYFVSVAYPPALMIPIAFAGSVSPFRPA